MIYNWDFGDGFQGESLQATHTYDQSQTFNVTLTAISNTGLKKSRTQIVVVGVMPPFGVDYWIWAIITTASLAIVATAVIRFLRKYLRRKRLMHLDAWLNKNDQSDSTREFSPETYVTF